MDSETKNKVVKSMKWSSVDTMGTQAVQFILSIIIARQLTPDDYGLIGMLAIFIAISTTFVESGFGSALIQKKDANDADFSTAFFFNVGVATILYLVLYVCSPLIADFYKQPLLVQVTRIYMLTLPISALSQVHGARMSKYLEFKSKAIISIASLIIGGTVGLILAYSGYGVWALVWQNIVSAIVTSLMYWGMAHWHPLFIFSKKSFRHLFNFGGKLLGSSLINTVYNNISTIIIGKVYNAADLGLYSRARGFSILPVNVITSMIMRVNYPVMSQLQDDNVRLLEAYKAILRAPMFILFPILLGMASVSYPMVEVLLGKQWLGCVPLLIILCLGSLWTPLSTINLNLLYVKGRTDLVLKLEVMKKPIAFVMLIASIPLGIEGMCSAIALYEIVAFSFNCYYTGRTLDYGFWKQVRELLPLLGYATIMSIAVIASIWFVQSALLKLVVGIPVGVIVYLSVAWISHDETLKSFIGILAPRFPLILARHKDD